MQRQNVTARWAKSRQTPVPSSYTSNADVLVDEVADRLDTRPAEWSRAEERPRRLGELVRLAVTAAEKVHQVLGRKVSHIDLSSICCDEVRKR